MTVNNQSRRAVYFIVLGALPPHDTNVLWLDTSNVVQPILKIFWSGAWIPLTGGDVSKLINDLEISLNTTWSSEKLNDILNSKQGLLTAGDNISINDNVISAVDTKYTASDFDIKDLSDSTGLREVWSEKQDRLTEGSNISINNGVISAISLKEITYSDLKALRDNAQLIPGQKYRIIDFVTTVGSTISSYIQSTAHSMDIIVTADSTSILNENVYFALPSNDEDYFNNCKIESWIGQYCLDNDTNRFEWADEVNGKGVIYFMKDEWDNEAPYDFKNIQCKFDGDNNWYYLYEGYNGNTRIGDGTLTGVTKNNKMLPYIDGTKRKINRIVLSKNPCNNIIEQNCYNLKLTSDGALSNLMVYRGTQNVQKIITGNITYQRVLGKRTNEQEAIIANPMDFLISSVVGY